MRRRFLIPLAAVIIGCGSEDPTKPPFGSELSVAEQVAIEAAFEKVADSLDLNRRTPDDSIMADFARVAARLVRLEGRYGTINVTVPGSATPVEMRAVAVSSSDAGSSAKVLLAWEELDVATFSVERAVVMQFGGFSGTVLAQLRYLDMTGAATAGLYAGAGTLTFSAPSFTNGCTGLENTADETCKAGKLTAAGEAQVARGAEAPVAVSWPAATIAAFELVVK